MSGLKWSSELSVGVKDIDDQHKHLINIANKLLEAVSDNAGRIAVDRIITHLREYTVTHFNSEEQLMQDYHYPKHGAHATAHNQLKMDVQRFQRALYEKQDVTHAEVMTFLKSWLLDHLLNEDRDFARFIKEQSSEGKTVEV